MRVDVDEVDRAAAIQRAVRARRESDRAGPHRIARAHPERQAGDVQRRSAAVDGDRMARAADFANRLLEDGHGRALGQEIRAQDICDGLDVRLGDVPAGHTEY